MALLKTYMDESGIHDRAPVVAVAKVNDFVAREHQVRSTLYIERVRHQPKDVRAPMA